MERLRKLVRGSHGAQEQRFVQPTSRSETVRRLIDAIIHDNAKELAELLAACSDIDPREFVFGRSQRSLHHVAASLGATECLRLLVARGGNPDQQDVAGVTATHLSARNGHKRCLRLLVEELHADTRIVDSEGFTAVHWLASNGRTELLNYMLDLGQDVGLIDHQGQTALHVACQSGHAASATSLVQRGANLEKQDEHGRTPLWCACKYGQADCAQILLQHHAKLQADKDGVDPFDICVTGNHPQTAAVLAMSYPQLLRRTVAATSDVANEEAKMIEFLRCLCQHGSMVCRALLLDLAGMTATSGHLLLSLSSDSKVLAARFIRLMHLLKAVIESCRSLGPRNKDEVAVLDRIVIEGLSELEGVWDALEEWMRILQEEARPGAVTYTRPERAGSFFPRRPSSPAGEQAEAIHSDAGDSRSAAAPTAAAEESQTPAAPDESKPPAEAQETETVLPQPASEAPSSAVGWGGDLDDMPLLDDDEGDDAPLIGAVDGPDAAPQPAEAAASAAPLHAAPSARGREERQPIVARPRPLPNVTRPEGVAQGAMLPLFAERVCAVTNAYYTCCCLIWTTSDLPPKFLEFVRQHVPVLRAILARTPTLIFGDLHFLLKHSVFMQDFRDVVTAQPFDLKRQWFYEQLYQLGRPDAAGTVRDGVFTVQRERVFESSCGVLAGVSPEKLKGSLNVRFEGEEGVGAGVKREWFTVLSHEILNPDYALFIESSDGTYQPNANSDVNPDHLSFFHFAGRAVGLAIFHKQLLDVYFTRSFYKHILKTPNNYSDVASLDPEYAQSLTWILEHDITDMGLDLTFSVDTDAFGAHGSVELIPGGRNVPVTEENKHGYVQLISELKMTRAIRQQIAAFLEGFELFIPHSLVAMFDEYELELLMSGVPDIDVADWRAHTVYSQGLADTDDLVQWFWAVIDRLTARERALLLQFVTGSSRLPIGGFAALKGHSGSQHFTISQAEINPEGSRLPTASTCFNLLKLPAYTSEKQLENRLSVALNCGSEGFSSA